MIDPALFGAFMAAALALNLTPGPDMAYVAGRGAVGGVGAGIAAAFGIALGALVHTAFAAIGLSAILATLAIAFEVLRWTGAAYLVWLALRLWREPAAPVAAAPPDSIAAYRRIAVEGALINILNPKVALFFLALLPQFVRSDAGSAALQFAVLGLAFNVSGTLVNCGVAWLSGRARRAVGAGSTLARWTRRLVALLFLGLAARLALVERG